MKSVRSRKQIESSFKKTFHSRRFGIVDMLFGIRLYFDEGYFSFHANDNGPEDGRGAGNIIRIPAADTSNLETRSLDLENDNLLDVSPSTCCSTSSTPRKRHSCAIH